MTRRAAPAVVALVVVLALLAVACRDGGSGTTTTTTTAVPSRSTVTTAARAASFADSLLAVTTDEVRGNRTQVQLTQLDSSFQPVGTTALGSPVGDDQVPARAHIALDGNVAFVVTSAGDSSQVQLVTPKGPGKVTSVPVPDVSVAIGGGAAWVAAGASVLELSTADGATIATVTAPALPAAFRARHVAVAGGRVWVAADDGTLVTIDPQSLAVAPADPITIVCPGYMPTLVPTPEPIPNTERAALRALTTVGAFVVALGTAKCVPDAHVIAIDPVANARLAVTVAGPTDQRLDGLSTGKELVLTRVQSNDLVPVPLDGRPVGAPIALPKGSLAETCGAGRRGVACTSGLDELAFVTIGTVRPGVETHRSRAIEGGALAWAVG